jgi:hypothetical protein
MTGVINDIGYSVSVSYVINDTRHAVLVSSVLVYSMSLMTPIILS